MKRERIDVEKLGRERKIIGVEDCMWYDGIAYYLDESTGQRYSRNGYPMADDEMCKPTIDGRAVCKTECIIDGSGRFDYHYKILSTRPDNDDK